MLTEEQNQFLADLYYNKHGAAGAFMGIDGLYKTARRLDKTIKRADVTDFLNHQSIYQTHFDDTQTRHRDFLKSAPKRVWHVSSLGFIGFDVLYLQQKLKGPFPFLMVGVDLFSTKIYASFLKTLDAKTGLAAIKRLLTQIEYPVISIVSDRGGEMSMLRPYLHDLKRE